VLSAKLNCLFDNAPAQIRQEESFLFRDELSVSVVEIYAIVPGVEWCFGFYGKREYWVWARGMNPLGPPGERLGGGMVGIGDLQVDRVSKVVALTYLWNMLQIDTLGRK
jgi:hypothetical protein